MRVLHLVVRPNDVKRVDGVALCHAREELTSKWWWQIIILEIVRWSVHHGVGLGHPLQYNSEIIIRIVYTVSFFVGSSVAGYITLELESYKNVYLPITFLLTLSQVHIFPHSALLVVLGVCGQHLYYCCALWYPPCSSLCAYDLCLVAALHLHLTFLMVFMLFVLQ